MSLALATSPGAVAPQDGVYHFDKLPQELLDMVCDFAYGYQTERLIITKGQYMQNRESALEMGKLASIPPFKHHVDQFLVSPLCYTGGYLAVTNQDIGLEEILYQRRGSLYQGSAA